MGAAGIRRALMELDPPALASGNGTRAQLAKALHSAELHPADLVFEAWPILRHLQDTAQWGIPDRYLNLERKNANLARLVELGAPDVILANEVRNLQRAVEQIVGVRGDHPGLLDLPPLDPVSRTRLLGPDTVGHGWVSDLLRSGDELARTLAAAGLTGAVDDLSQPAAQRGVAWHPG